MNHKWIHLTLFILLAALLGAENLYVRSESGSYGREDGSDWTNAFKGLADIAWGDGVGRAGAGDTLYIAGGVYTTHLVPEVDGTRANPLRIRRATVADHGAATGWQVAFDGLVHMQGAYIDLRQRSFIEVDGVSEDGLSISGLTKINGTVKYVWIGSDVTVPAVVSTGITLKNLELIGPGQFTCDGTCGIAVFGSDRRVNELVLSHIKAHDFSAAAIRLGEHDGVLIENCEIYDIDGATAEECGGPGTNPHNTHIALYGEIQSDNIIIRNCWFYQVHTPPNETLGGYAIGMGYVSGNLDIYNNVFYRIVWPLKCTQNDLPSVPGTKISIMNNTFVGYRTTQWTDFTRFTMVNNIFCNVGIPLAETRWPYARAQAEVEATNLFTRSIYTDSYTGNGNIVLPDGVQPFANYQSPDLGQKFRLAPGSAAIGAGTDLSSRFATDIDGQPRPPGQWSIGAFAYVPMLTLTSPNGGETWPRNRQRAITWAANEISGNVIIELLQNGNLVGLIAEVPATPGSYLWTVGTYQGGTIMAGSGYKIRVRTADGATVALVDM